MSSWFESKSRSKKMKVKKRRCAWVGDGDLLMEKYHDTEWGVPLYDDQKIFEYLVLESFQAGLSWRTITPICRQSVW